MPGEIIDRPNPQPLASKIDDNVLSLAVKLEKTELDQTMYIGLQKFRRAANYIAAGKIQHYSRVAVIDSPHPSYDIPTR